MALKCMTYTPEVCYCWDILAEGCIVAKTAHSCCITYPHRITYYYMLPTSNHNAWFFLCLQRWEILVCYCRKRGCTRRERINGTCRKGHLMYTLCCLWTWRPQRTRLPWALRPLMLGPDEHFSINCSQYASCVFTFFQSMLQGSVKALYIKYHNLQRNLCRWMNTISFYLQDTGSN